jgi:recombinational DNA repair ATPase RecF
LRRCTYGEFEIENFRSCLGVKVLLQPTLTLLVDENNAGKSNVIDALRLATMPLSGRRSRYLETEDVSRDGAGEIGARLDVLRPQPVQTRTATFSLGFDEQPLTTGHVR